MQKIITKGARAVCRTVLSIVVAGVLTGSAIGTASAIVFEKDFNASGDNLLTVDSTTGLEWLDLTATLGQNYFDVLAGSFVTSSNFRYATQAEVATLFESFAIPAPFNTSGSGALFTADKLAPVSLALTLMGQMFGVGFQQGLYDQGTTLGFTLLRTNNDNGTPTAAKATLFQGTGLAKTHNFNGYVGIGSYLVRASVVPVPAALPLFGTGLAVLGLIGWRRKRKAV